MSTISYEEVLGLARQLPIPEQLRLLQVLLGAIRLETATENEGHSILDLRGLGSEIWRDLNVNDYIDEERASWTG